MNYELARELKAAGFPQRKDLGDDLSFLAYCDEADCCDHELHLIHHDNDEGMVCGNDYSHRWDNRWNDEIGFPATYAPTLSELIEACGDNIFQLTKGKTVWWATDTYEIEVEGSSPEEAVARLWLAIHTPKL